MTLFNIQTKYLTLKSKYDFSSRSKTWLSDSFKIPIYEATILCTPIYSLQRGLTFLVDVNCSAPTYIPCVRAVCMYHMMHCAILASSKLKSEKNPLVAHFDNSYNLWWCFHYSVVTQEATKGLDIDQPIHISSSQ